MASTSTRWPPTSPVCGSGFRWPPTPTSRALRNPDFKIDSGDALLVDWPSRFAEAFAGGRGGFDIVLANPPYQNMFSQTRPGRRKGGQAPFAATALPAVPAKGARPLFRPAYRTAIRKAFETARGGFDIFVPFMELGIQILRDHGMLAYITPNKLLERQVRRDAANVPRFARSTAVAGGPLGRAGFRRRGLPGSSPSP